MKKISFLAVAIIIIHLKAFAQDQQQYSHQVKEAMELYDAKEYQASASKFSLAFEALGGKAYPNDRYNAACSYALAGNTDTAFYHLFRIAHDSRYKNYNHISIDADLVSLHNDKRWHQLLDVVRANKDAAEAGLNKSLTATLDSIYQEDQKYRMQLEPTGKQYGWDSKEMKELWKVINEKDSINLIKVKNIIDTHGWLGPDSIGSQGSSTLFLVIQHSDLETQEEYLPLMREAVRKGNASASSLALLEDRVALKKGEKQVYGSQISRNDKGEYSISPLVDPDNVDKRREAVGLGPLQEYLSHWGITWDVEAYKKQQGQNK